MKLHSSILRATLALAWACTASLTSAADSDASWDGDRIQTPDGELRIRPIHHATFAMGWKGRTLYVDPVGGANRFASLPRPDLVLITDIHGDHLHVETVRGVCTSATRLVTPPAVAAQLPEDLRGRTIVLTNGQTASVLEFQIEAVPAYNLTPERLKFHPRGRGNGYVVSSGSTRVYISGDTEDVPEMRNLRDITVAFVCMNLPYTMTVDQAADAVRAFRPHIVYPYHYRGSDLDRFRERVGSDLGIEVRIRDWYRD